MNSVEINDKALALLRGEKVYAGDAKNGTVNPVFIAAAIELARYHFDVSPKPKTIGEMLAPDILY
jgi:hypothetical protein